MAMGFIFMSLAKKDFQLWKHSDWQNVSGAGVFGYEYFLSYSGASRLKVYELKKLPRNPAQAKKSNIILNLI